MREGASNLLVISEKRTLMRGRGEGLIKKVVFIFFVLVLCLSLVGSASAAPISSCTNINSPGTYVLNTDILDSSSSSCINITSSNVTLDGAGYNITGNSGGYGIVVNGSIKNTTIKNVEIYNVSIGIYFNNSNVSGFTIANNTIESINESISLNLDNICYNMSGSSSAVLGDLIVYNNTITAGGDGVYFDAGYWGAYMYDSSSCQIGALKINQNNISSNSNGIYLDHLEYLGYKMYNDSSFTMGNITFNDNTINSTGIGLYLYEILYFGYYNYDNSSFTMGSIEVDRNVIESDSAGIENDNLGVFGEYMYNNSVFTMGDIEFNDNTINSSSYGMYLTAFDFGYYMYGSSSFTMGDMQVNNNSINSSSFGLYLYYFAYELGYNMYGNSSFTTGSITVNSNTINSSYDGIYASRSFEGFGWDMNGNSSVTMGDIELDNNTIISGDSGMYITDYVGYWGRGMYGNSSFTMGDVHFNDNTINSSSYGMYLYDLYEWGYYMYGNSSFTMGNVEFNGNTINSSNSYGMYLDYFERIGYYMYNDSSFTMGNITFNDNTITSSYDGIYYYLYGLGSYMYNNSSFTMDDIQFNDNVIQSGDDGLYIYYIGSLGSRMYDNASFTLGNILVNNNDINSSSYGIYEDIEYIGYQVVGNSSFTMGSVEFNYNNITSGSEGMYLDEISSFAYTMDGNSTYKMGDILVKYNNITSGDDGIYVYNIDLGSDLNGNSNFSMGNLEFSHNTINSSIDGMYFKYISAMYIAMNDSTHEMGDILVTDNNISSTYDGIYFYDIRIPFRMYDNTSMLMGNFRVNSNNITSGNDGITFNGYGDYLFGYKLYDNSSFTMGNLEFNTNTINSSNDSLYIDMSGFGDYMYNDSSFTMGEILINSNSITGGSNGTELHQLENATISGNTIQNAINGIYLNSSSNNLIYNNLFNNTNNFYISSSMNNWNTTKTGGTNIISGPYIGGNFWANPSGTGFSDICPDSDSDGICDSGYNLASGNEDYLPLSLNFSKTITVCSSGCDYTSIQAAINAASAGDTIQVQAGIYTENVVVNKSLNIIGAGTSSTTVQNATAGVDVFNVVADWVNISGFKIEGALDSNYASIHINGANFTNITNNNVTGSWYGIHLSSSSNNTIYNNLFNNTVNFYFSGTIYTNDWNTTKTAGTNIVGGSYLGGNFWAKPDGTGFSENATCSDSDSDGICDTNYTLASNNVDYLPLTTTAAPTAGTPIDVCTTINSPGTYTLTTDILDSSSSSCINVTSSDVVFDGAGYTIDGVDTSGTYGVLVNSTTALTNVTVKNLNVTDWYYGIYYRNAENGTIKNNTASLNTWDGVHLDYSHYNTIANNTLTSNGDDGVELYSSNNNTVEGNTLDLNDYGVYIESWNPVYGNIIRGNTITNTTFDAISIYDGDNDPMYNMTIEDNVIINATEGILLESEGQGIYDITIENNTIRNASDTGIDLWGVSNYVYNITVLENTITESGYGVYIYKSNNNSITNNTASSNTQYGIYLSSSNNNTISNNTANSNIYGIYLQTSSSNALTNNTASSNTQYGLYIRDSNNNTFINSNISGNDIGIFLYTWSGTVSGNIIKQNRIESTTKGIYATDECSPDIFNNTIADNVIVGGSYGIHVYSYCNAFYSNTIRNNTITNLTGTSYGIYIWADTSSSATQANNNVIDQNNISNATYGIYLEDTIDNNITSNIIWANTWGFRFYSSTNNLFDNLFNNTNNFYFSSSSNTWNTTKTAGTNIVGGSYLGGNFWAKPDGTGFSENATCSDSDSDGICDTNYTLASNNVDYLPLKIVTGGASATEANLTVGTIDPGATFYVNGSLASEGQNFNYSLGDYVILTTAFNGTNYTDEIEVWYDINVSVNVYGNAPAGTIYLDTDMNYTPYDIFIITSTDPTLFTFDMSTSPSDQAVKIIGFHAMVPNARINAMGSTSHTGTPRYLAEVFYGTVENTGNLSISTTCSGSVGSAFNKIVANRVVFDTYCSDDTDIMIQELYADYAESDDTEISWWRMELTDQFYVDDYDGYSLNDELPENDSLNDDGMLWFKARNPAKWSLYPLIKIDGTGRSWEFDNYDYEDYNFWEMHLGGDFYWYNDDDYNEYAHFLGPVMEIDRFDWYYYYDYLYINFFGDDNNNYYASDRFDGDYGSAGTDFWNPLLTTAAPDGYGYTAGSIISPIFVLKLRDGDFYTEDYGDSYDTELYLTDNQDLLILSDSNYIKFYFFYYGYFYEGTNSHWVVEDDLNYYSNTPYSSSIDITQSDVTISGNNVSVTANNTYVDSQMYVAYRNKTNYGRQFTRVNLTYNGSLWTVPPITLADGEYYFYIVAVQNDDVYGKVVEQEIQLGGSVHNLDTSQDYLTIQAAINAASSGHTISVDAGTYTENIVVNKSITLTGAGVSSTTVQNATAGSDVFNVVADWVNISGFKIEGALDSNYASIHINGANFTNITNNNVTGSWYGIHVDRGLNNTITNNTATLNQNDGILLNHSNYTTVKKNTAKDNSQAGSYGNGVCLGAGENYNNVIEDNIITGNYFGIYLYNSKNNTIANNNVSSNNQEGIYLSSSDNNTMANNTASNNYDYGIHLESSSHNTMANNTASNNTYGIYLEYSSNNNITDNNASNNNDGIFLSESTNNTIANNTASNNYDYGINLYESSSNIVENNNASSSTDTGIYLACSGYNNLTKNKIWNNSYGIFLEGGDCSTLTRYNLIKNNTAYNNTYGIYLTNSNNNTIENNTANSNNEIGIYLYSSNNNTLRNNTASFNTGGEGNYGIYFSLSSNNILTENTADSNNNHGISFSSNSNNNTLTENTASSNILYGIYLVSSNNNAIYNNFFNNTNNFYISSSTNDWNTTLANSTNIIGGPWLGGNFWAKPTGTGFSETCTDTDYDQICDVNYTLDSGNVDYLPLAPSVTPKYTVSGFVYNTTANIEGAMVYLVNASNNSVAANTTTNSTGGYSISIPQGTYYLYATHTYHDRSSNTSSFSVTAAVPGKNIEMTPLPGKFTGVVYYTSGESTVYPSGATVYAMQGGSTINSTTTNSTGNFTFYVKAGTYDLKAEYNSYAGLERDQEVGLGATKVVEIEVYSTTVTINGTVSDSINRSYNISGATVTVDQTGDSTTTNSDGYYSLTVTNGSIYTLTATATNYHKNTSISTGLTTTDMTLDILLTPKNGSIIGTVSDVDGKGVKSPTITVTNTTETTGPTPYTVTAGALGTYVVTDVVPWTTYNVTADGATARFNSSSGSTTMTPGGAKTVDITLAHVKLAATPTVQVAPNSPITPKNFTITIYNKGLSQTTFDIGLIKGNLTGSNATLNPSTVVVGASSTNTTILSANSSLPGYYNFTANATSQEDPDVFSNITVYLGVYSAVTEQLLVNTVNDTISNLSESITIDSTINTTNATSSIIIGSITENATLTDSVVKEGSTVNATTLTNATVEGSTVKDATITESTLVDSTVENSSTITGSSTVEDSIISQTNVSSSSKVEDSNLTGSTITGSAVVGYEAANVTITSDNLTTATVAGDQTATLTTPEGVEFNLTSDTLTEDVALDELVPGSETITKTVATTSFAANVTDRTTGEKAIEIDIDSSSTTVNLVIAKTKIPAAAQPIYNMPPGVGYLYIEDKAGNLQTAIQTAMIKLYYDKNNLGGLDESSLRVQWYNGTDWKAAAEDDNNNGIPDVDEMTTATKAVHGFDGYVCPWNPTRSIPGVQYCGINTEEGYVFANVTHLSVYGMYGSVYGGAAAITTAPTPSRTKNVIREMNDPTVTFPSKLVPGESASLTILLENTGNVVEKVVATMLDLPEGWIVTGESSVNLKPGEKKTMILTIKIPQTEAGQKSFTVKLKAVDSMKTWDKPITVSISEAEVAPPATTAPPVTTPPPATTAPPITTAPPATTAPPVTTPPPTPLVKKPTITTKPPVTTAAPVITAPPKPEKKGICGPTLILLLILTPLLFSRIRPYPKIFK